MTRLSASKREPAELSHELLATIERRLHDAGVALTGEHRAHLAELADATAQTYAAKLVGRDTSTAEEALRARSANLEAAAGLLVVRTVRDSFSDVVQALGQGVVRALLRI